PKLTQSAFSSNSRLGACPDCQGLGAVYDFDPARLVPDESRSLQDGAIAPWAKGDRTLVRGALPPLSRTFGIDLSVPFRRLPKNLRDIILYGAPGAARRSESEGASKKKPKEREVKDPFGAGFEGLVPNLRRRYDEGAWVEQENLEPYRALRPCPACQGARPQT